MKVKHLLGIIVVLLIGVVIGGTYLYSESKTPIIEQKSSQKYDVLSMMLETKLDSGEYLESADITWEQAIKKGYKYNDTLSKCENGGTLTWDDTNKTVTYSGDKTDKCYIYFDKATLSEAIINFYTKDGVNGLYKHDGQGTYGEYEAGDNSYRFAGADPNNYVCFGSSAPTCPTDNLYRIIGIIDGRIKLIKYDYATSDLLGTDGAYSTLWGPDKTYYKGKLSTIHWFYWNSSTNSNIWSESNLNKINLNKNYWDNLGITWQAYIDDSDWKVGGNTQENLESATNSRAVYTAEIINPAEATIYNAKIGLMYISDFRYAADPAKANAWSNLASIDYYAVHTDNWMSMGGFDWTITRTSGSVDSLFRVRNTGLVYQYLVANEYNGVRPTFYLKPEVELKSGLGTQENPYRIVE